MALKTNRYLNLIFRKNEYPYTYGTLMPLDFSLVLCSWCSDNCSEQLFEQVALRILKQCSLAGVPIIGQSNVRNTTPYT